MSFVCVNLTGSWGVPPTYQVTALATQPTDFSGCQYVLSTGADYAALIAQINASPDLSDLTAQVENLQSLVNSLSSSGNQQEPFDYTLAAQFWVFAFSVTLTFWLVSHVAGMIIKPVRRG